MAQSSTTRSFHIIFTGHVQGVGFRFTAQRFAHELGLAGWVRNMPDEASVELLAQGDAVQVERLTARLKEHFLIHDVRIHEGAPGVLNPSFEIRY